MRSRLVRAFVPVLTLVACTTPTAPSLREVMLQRAQWQAAGLTDYSYVWAEYGFFVGYEGQPFRLEVRDGVVRAGLSPTTGDTVPWPWTQFPTIDTLFDRAIAAMNDHKLTAIAFDARYHYPTRMELAGPADASGSVFASQLAPAR